MNAVRDPQLKPYLDELDAKIPHELKNNTNASKDDLDLDYNKGVSREDLVRLNQ